MNLVNKVEEFVMESFMKSHKNKDSKEINISHAKNTLEWVIKLYPQADLALQIAALGHDIDRAYDKIDDNSFFNAKKSRKMSYNKYKKEHALRSAYYISDYLKNHGANEAFNAKVRKLIESHEKGGSFDSEILKYADAISFMDNNFDSYLRRYGKEKALFKLNWTYNRLKNASIDKKNLDKVQLLYRKRIADLK